MSKNTLLLTLVCLSICSIFFGCAATSTKSTVDNTSNPPIDTGTFVIIENEYTVNSRLYHYIMYDPDTMVMYSYLSSGNSAGLTVMYNADGTLKLYEPNSETN